MCQIQDYHIIDLNCSEKTIYKNSKKYIGIQRKYKEQMEEFHDNGSAFLHQNIKTNS